MSYISTATLNSGNTVSSWSEKKELLSADLVGVINIKDLWIEFGILDFFCLKTLHISTLNLTHQYNLMYFELYSTI
jgi:hypothetical protein